MSENSGKKVCVKPAKREAESETKEEETKGYAMSHGLNHHTYIITTFTSTHADSATAPLRNRRADRSPDPSRVVPRAPARG